MLLGVRYIADVAIVLAALALLEFVATRLFRESWRNSIWFKGLHWLIGILLLAGAVANGALILYESAQEGLIHERTAWLRGAALAFGLSLLGSALIARFFPPLDPSTEPKEDHEPERRKFLSYVGQAAVAAPLVITGVGGLGRNQFQLNEVSIPIPNLPKDLDGLRIVQISDVHLSPFLSEKEFSRAIGLANETKSHLAVVTGDLITAAGDPLDEALRQVARLKADAGIYGCHGNHERYADALDYATLEGKRLGIRFLRSAAAPIQFGNASLNLCGVDYEQMHSPYLTTAKKLVKPGNVNLLLSHNPDVFPVAKDLGFDLTLAGHTHGGQINFEILQQELNIVRFITPYTRGLYSEEGKSIYVSTGIGTVGVPVRFGAPPEVALIRLCAT